MSIIPEGYISATMLGFPCPNDHGKRVSDCVLGKVTACTVCQSYTPPPSPPVEARHEGKGTDT